MNDPASVSVLSALVRRTEGVQPWRKVFHAVNGLLIALGLSLLELPDPNVVAILGGIAAVLLAVDLTRLAAPPANELFFRLFNRLASPREMGGLASSTWYALGVLATALLFERPALISAVLVLGLADPAAAYVGRRWGRRPFLGGTVLGSVAFYAITISVLALRHGPWVALAGATAVTTAERKSWPLDDNFTIPIVCAAVVWGAGLLRP